MNIVKFGEYAKIKSEIKRLNKQADAMKDDLIDELSGELDEKYETKFATFFLTRKPKWKYSKELSDKEKGVKLKIKQLKMREEKDGTAEKVTDGVFLTCQLGDRREK